MGSADSRTQMRRFGILVGAIFGLIALWPWLIRGEGLRSWAIGISVVLILLGAAKPGALRPLYRAWMAFAAVLAWINTRILLGLTYFLVMTPTGLLMRLWGRDPLDRRLGDRPSYWINKLRTRDPRTSMERLF